MSLFSNFLKRVYKTLKQRIYVFYLQNIRKKIVISSKPYISGDTFKNVCDIVIDEKKIKTSKNSNNIKYFFVQTNSIQDFFKFYNEKSKNFVLITHNSDIEIDQKLVDNYLTDNIVWFAQNLNVDYLKYKNLFPIPIGFENRNYLNNGRLRHFNNVLIPDSKVPKIFSAVNLSTNPERLKMVNSLKDNDLVLYHNFSGHKNFLNQMAKFKFTLVPEGNGKDTHRLWEAIHVKTVPISISNQFTLNLKNLGVPIYLISDWSELNNLSETDINNHFLKFSNDHTFNDFTNFEYWKKYIITNSENYFYR